MKKLLLFFPLALLILCYSSIETFAQTAAFTVSQSNGCVPFGVSVSNTSTGNITSWYWNFGNSSISTSQNPSGTTYNTPGVYTILLAVSGPGGSDTLRQTITASGKPGVIFAAAGPTQGCVNFPVQFNPTVVLNSTGNPTYNWDFGDGYSSGSTSPTHTYTSPGTYPVSLHVTNGAGCDSTYALSSYITANSKPTASFSVTTPSFCTVPGKDTFTSSSTGGIGPYTYTWRYGDGGNGTGSPSYHTYNSGGAFNVTLIVTDGNSCVDSTTSYAGVTVNILPATFFGPSKVCDGQPANFANTTSGGINATWTFGDGQSGAGTNVAHTYAGPGTYTVIMTTTVGTCIKVSAPQTITVNAKPTVSFTYAPAIPCPAPDSIIFTGTTNGTGSVFQWRDKTNNIVFTGNPFLKHYAVNTEDYITMIVTNANGCVDSAYDGNVKVRGIIVNIQPGPAPNVPDDTTHYAGCIPLPIDFSVNLYSTLPPPPLPNAYLPYPASAITWEWDFGDGTPKDYTATPHHVYTVAGTYIVTCKVTTSNGGCPAIGTRYVHADTKVTPSFTAHPLVICPKDTVYFINTTVTTLNTLVYTWDVGETSFTVTNKDSVPYKYILPGIYDIKLYADHNGCIESTKVQKYIYVRPPGAKFDYVINCPPSLSVNFYNQSDSATSQVWDFGDHTTDTSSSPTHNYSGPGIYVVKLTAYNNISGCHDVYTKTINIFTAPLAFTASDTTLCVNDITTFTANFQRNGAINFSWSFDGGAFTTPDPSPTIPEQYFLKGYHTIKLIATSGNGCVDSLTKTNYILVSQPDVRIHANPPVGCEPQDVILIDSTINTPGVHTMSQDWYFGDATTQLNLIPSPTIHHMYYFKGDYTVKLVVVDSQGCADSIQVSRLVSIRKPTATFTTPKDSVCYKAPVSFNSNSIAVGPITYIWDFGDTKSSNLMNPVHAYTDTGWFTVKLTVKDTVGCTDQITHMVYVSGPHAGFYMSDSLSVCNSIQILFTDTSARSVSYLWSFGAGGGGSGLENPVHTFSGSGIYHITQIVYDLSGCTDTAISTVRILGYGGGFSYSATKGCVPQTIRFSPPTKGIAKLTWDFGDGNIAITAGTDTTHTYLSPGKYVPKVIFSDGKSCTSSSVGSDTITIDKVTSNFTWTTPCIDTPFTLTQLSSAVYSSPNSWFWYFGAGDTSISPSLSYNFHSSGNHTVMLVSQNAYGCKDTVTKQVFINPLPNVQGSPDKGLCPGDSTYLYATGAVTYQWSPASLVSCTLCDTTKVYILPQPTYYYVVGTDKNGCINRDSIKVYIQLKTTDSTGTGGAICIGESFRLFASGADHYLWAPAESLDSPRIASPLATPTHTTTYLLIAQEGTCKVDSVLVTVGVNPLPIFSAGNDEVMARGTAVTLHPTQYGIDHIVWRADTTLSCLDCFLPNAHPRYTHTYYATGYDKNGCFTSDSVTVFVRCNGDLVFIPNTFTPNGDGNNDHFFPRGEGIDQMSSFRVFNRWGEMVFERSNINVNDELAGWDGTYKGQALPPDTYVYIMQSRCEDGSTVQWKGDINLLR